MRSEPGEAAGTGRRRRGADPASLPGEPGGGEDGGAGGGRVAEELLEDPETSSIPIVFLTARAELRDQARGLDLGGLDYVTKPFNPVELAQTIRDVVSRVEGGERDELRRTKLAELRALIEER